MSLYTSRQSGFETSYEEKFVELPVTVLIEAGYFLKFLTEQTFVPHRHIGQFPNDSYTEANSTGFTKANWNS